MKDKLTGLREYFEEPTDIKVKCLKELIKLCRESDNALKLILVSYIEGLREEDLQNWIECTK